MSCFWDIYINNKTEVPQYKRILNSDWCVESEVGWLSKPSSYRKEFYKIHHNSAHTLIILGQFYEPVNQDELLQHCIAYTKGEQNNFNDPAGHYIILLKNNTDSTCHVITNRLGTYHAYYLQSSAQNIISSYWLGLAKQAKNKVLDWEGITGFFATGFFPSDKTYLTDIKIFEPASCYSFDASLRLISKKRYWNWQYNPSNTKPEECINEIGDTLENILSYSMKNYETALPISGGLDSRMLAGIIATMKPEKERIWSYSYGYTKNSKEIGIAEKIAKSIGLKFKGYEVPDYLFKEVDTITDSVELFQYLDGTRQACMRSVLEDQADVVVGGHWGDVWMDSTAKDTSNESALTGFFHKKIVKRGSDWLLNNICADKVSDPTALIEEQFTTGLAKYDSISNPHVRLKAWKTDNWSFRWTLASIRMYQAGAFPVLPFYDKRLVELFCNIPSQYHRGRNLQIEFIKAKEPALAKIEWQKYGKDLYSYKRFNNRGIVYRAANKLKRTLSGTKNIQRNWELFYLNPSGKENLTKVLLIESPLTDHVGKERIEQILQDFYNNPSAANGYTISMLHTFAQFLKQIN